ncbi:YggS family pyridoxal phosphate-dependent enzyme [Anaeromyxobacter paludicola]|uniref:Pyridoxal phosphate homeostasis protein n=1 Tax=Anaeromyxobacter paludicola TaxID=2918171 RepID=A0ABM7X5M7_9BACT|nr:YggS family pyridoxal phosphate-dependent enzyme [Anaeromyxobacter paludicola]BDG07119.1 YggS family pyridoxal phosphate enzyme [Anaeromyxobacter paludicola]
MSGIAERLGAIRAGLPERVTLVAVSKTQPPEAVREAYAAGQRHFGENYAQEWRAKADALADLPELVWHFIGGLQTNKVKYLAGRVGYVHTLDRLELARELSRRFAARGASVRVLLEVNVAGEAAKAGCAPAEVGALADAVRGLPALELRGLMCIPPAEGDPRPHFAALRRMNEALGLPDLSMGMSGDYLAAVAEGATLVRVGTAIFGARAPRAG